MSDIYSLYKPLRNHLRPLPLVDSLAVIRGYAQHIQYGKPVPRDIRVHTKFLNASNWAEKGIFMWELEILAKEIIINAESITQGSKSLKEWPYFSQSVNKLKKLENDIASLYPKGSILMEMHRIAHRQFPWQVHLDERYLTRYYRIFRHPQLEKIILSKLGISTKTLYTIGLVCAGIYLDKFALNLPPDISIKSISHHDFERFLSYFSTDLESLRTLMIGSQKYDENYAYAFNQLKTYPLIKTMVNGKESLIAPIPGLLFRRFCDGLYYEICREPGFDESFGESFQTYIGEVIKRGFKPSIASTLPEQEYHVGKESKRTIDWIIEKRTVALFVECKTKRLTIGAKVHLDSEKALVGELEKMADFVVQIYKTMNDYKNGHYPNYPFDPKCCGSDLFGQSGQLPTDTQVG